MNIYDLRLSLAYTGLVMGKIRNPMFTCFTGPVTVARNKLSLEWPSLLGPHNEKKDGVRNVAANWLQVRGVDTASLE